MASKKNSPANESTNTDPNAAAAPVDNAATASPTETAPTATTDATGSTPPTAPEPAQPTVSTVAVTVVNGSIVETKQIAVGSKVGDVLKSSFAITAPSTMNLRNKSGAVVKTTDEFSTDETVVVTTKASGG